ncbi:MAG TPA: sigma-70 family RNA polymerase sigma factor [Symbiobacteriaceae bacterium]|nr:sigma-70 family RNA polymerase sigma factor [Symbiobacteriaceae bacterium]
MKGASVALSEVPVTHIPTARPHPVAVPTDEELVAAYLKSNKAAFEEIVRRYEDRLYRLSFRMLGNHHDALDAVQEILLKLMAALPKFQGRSRFGTWLYRLAANTCLDIRRKRGRTSAESLEATLEHSPGAALSVLDDHPSDNPDLYVEQHYREEMVRAALEQLPPSQRRLLVLRDLEDLSNSQVAEIMGIEVGALKARLHRARQALKRTLDGGVMVPGYATATSADAF